MNLETIKIHGYVSNYCMIKKQVTQGLSIVVDGLAGASTHTPNPRTLTHRHCVTDNYHCRILKAIILVFNSSATDKRINQTMGRPSDRPMDVSATKMI